MELRNRTQTPRRLPMYLRKRRVILVFIAFLVSVPASLFATDIPYVFNNGEVADAEQVNANFLALSNAIAATSNTNTAFAGRLRWATSIDTGWRLCGAGRPCTEPGTQCVLRRNSSGDGRCANGCATDADCSGPSGVCVSIPEYRPCVVLLGWVPACGIWHPGSPGSRCNHSYRPGHPYSIKRRQALAQLRPGMGASG